MDPLSIATGCASLITTIGSLTLSITSFVRSCREARSDLDRVSRELHSLQTVLELIEEDAKDDTKPFPETIQRHVSGIVTNCNSVVVEVQTCITKYGDGKVRNKAAWVLNGQGDMEKLRSSLEAHKSALELALDMLTLSVTKDIKADTTEIRNDTAAIKDDTSQILEEIARLQARLPVTAAAPNDYILQKFLEDMATYTESTLDVDGGFSDRASSKALSFIDEDEESSYISNQVDISIQNTENEDTVKASQGSQSTPATYDAVISEKKDDADLPREPPFARMVKRKSLVGTADIETAQAPAKEIGPTPSLTQQEPLLHFQRPQPDVKPPPAQKPTQIISPRLRRIQTVDDHRRYERLITILGKGQDTEKVFSQSRPSSDTSLTGSSRLVDKPEEQEPREQLEDLSPEWVYRIAYGITVFMGNCILELPVPETILKLVPRTDHDEFTHTRFTFVTCPPKEMVGERYCLRPTFWATKPVMKFILAVHVTPLHKYCLETWTLIHDAIAYAEKKLGEGTWKSVRVHIHFAGASTEWLSFLERTGAVNNFNIPPLTVRRKQVLTEALTEEAREVAGKRVVGTMMEVCQGLPIF
ncbi:hypothetical protein FPOAC2_07157 [Fusarium poae]